MPISLIRSVATTGLFSANFAIIPMEPFGAQVILPADVGAMALEQYQTLRVALINHKMLLIRKRKFLPADQLALTKIFGSELHRAGPKLRFLADYPEIFRISNQEQYGNKNTGQYWHADGHYLQDPSAVTVMHIVRATPDGDTCVVDTARAYELLSTDLKAQVEHSAFFNPETKVSHPMVRSHPVTKRLGLYVNLNAVAINQTTSQPVPVVSKVLRDYLSKPGHCYVHKWQDGDTMILDNFATAHSGTPNNPENLRIMHRTTVTGPSVWWRQ
jgi:alpha-ketoglutarate-dependent taurine dioxygenase